MSEQVKNKGWQVALAGTGINLALGVLYAWSIFKGAIKTSIEKGGPGAFDWNLASINDPYAVCCLTFAFAMILAGKCQDKIGPARTALIGGLLVGIGFTLLSQSNAYMAWVMGFGILAGAGFGFGYSAATPPALKWFPSSKTGLIAGIVVAGFGLAPVYIAPLSSYLLGTVGIQQAMLLYAAAFAVIVCGLSFFLVNPPAGYVPADAPKADGAAKAAPAKPTVNATASEMLRSGKFYILWVTYFIGAGAGLMVIGSVAGIAKKSMGSMAFLAVAIMALGNAGGRVVAGVLSDKIGRMATLLIMFVFQAVLMFAAIPVVGAGHPNAVLVVLLATFMGFNYGANLALFPSFSKDYWGLKNYGLNYGILFTAWGVGGFVMGRASEMLNTQTGSFNASFILAGALLSVGALVSLALKPAKAATPATAAAQPVPRNDFMESFMRGWADFLGFTPSTPRGTR
ncbi:L-lactate MFS transporter [Geobacter sulfurreducens]|uniref:L-lactate MFS transporter n=1 Tax=Geobacter sulfurreducens TaxID=35554 RepID=UPI002CE9BDE8|nr:OFA family MFS transporter [Geobacter sulfurreducens]HML78669.1 OFA family MFS transporter [Geobacter sulfurreducens]